MLTGIMAIFEMGLALTGQSLIPPPDDPYLENPLVKNEDQKLLNILSDPRKLGVGLERGELCSAVISAYQTAFPSVSNPWVEDKSNNASNIWRDSCIMNDGSHRILLVPGLDGELMQYQVYSCVLDNRKDRCSFEIESE